LPGCRRGEKCLAASSRSSLTNVTQPAYHGSSFSRHERVPDVPASPAISLPTAARNVRQLSRGESSPGQLKPRPAQPRSAGPAQISRPRPAQPASSGQLSQPARTRPSHQESPQRHPGAFPSASLSGDTGTHKPVRKCGIPTSTSPSALSGTGGHERRRIA
jgi:hypothetical protein